MAKTKSNPKQPKALLVSNQGRKTHTRLYTITDGVCYVPMRLLRHRGALFDPSEYWTHATIGTTIYPLKGSRIEPTNIFSR